MGAGGSRGCSELLAWVSRAPGSWDRMRYGGKRVGAGRHLQVEASGPGNAVSAASLGVGGKVLQVAPASAWVQVDGRASSGPGCGPREVSRVGARGVTSSRSCGPEICGCARRLGRSGQKLLRSHLRGLGPSRCAGSSGPGCEIQEVSRVGAQACLQSASALEMRVCGRNCGSIRGGRIARVAPAQPGSSRCAGALLGTWMRDTGGKSGRRPGRHLQVEARPWIRGCAAAAGIPGRRVLRSHLLAQVQVDRRALLGTWMRDTGGKPGRRPGRASKSKLLALEMPRVCGGNWGCERVLQVAPAGLGPNRCARLSSGPGCEARR